MKILLLKTFIAIPCTVSGYVLLVLYFICKMILQKPIRYITVYGPDCYTPCIESEYERGPTVYERCYSELGGERASDRAGRRMLRVSRSTSCRSR